jgi:hypothetical protein
MRSRHEVDDLLADRVVATGVVVGSILLAADESVQDGKSLDGTACSYGVADRGLQIHKDGTRDMLARPGCTEESGKRVDRFWAGGVNGIRVHGTIRTNAVLQAVQLPAVVSGLGDQPDPNE